MYREIKDKIVKDIDPEIIAWNREEIKGGNQPLIYSYPQPEDNIKNKKFFAVKDYERAIFYNKGELVGVLGGGVYELEKKAKIKGTEIVWIDASIISIQWGVPQTSGIPTKDGRLIGLHGDLKLKINDVKIFYNDIAAGKKEWTVIDLKDWIMSLLHTSLRDIFKNYKAKEVLLEERERIITRITSKITDEFLRYGLNLESFNLIGLKLPEGTEKLYEVDREQERTADELEMQKMKKDIELQKLELEAAKKDFKRKEELLDAKSKAEKAKYDAEAERIDGDVKTDLLERQQTAKVAGDVKIIEAKKGLEESEKKLIQEKISELKEKLDKFDNLLTEGKISSDVYNTRVNRIEKELKELERKLIS